MNVNGKVVCETHYFETINKECLFAELEAYVDELEEGRKLSSGAIEYLKKVRKHCPAVVDEFPRLFKDSC